MHFVFDKEMWVRFPLPPFLESIIMTEEEIKNLYMLQSVNVRELWKVKAGLIKDINYQIRKSDKFQVFMKTKLLSLIYSAWSETQFVQIFYTPDGFRYTEILKIQKCKKQKGIAAGWKYMLEEAMKKVGSTSENKDIKKRLQSLIVLVKKYIEEPCILRNKIAHGQWINALNCKNNALNEDITNQLSSLDPVELEKRFEIHRYLGYIVRDLVQSPKKGFHKHFWINIVNLEKYIKKTEKWSIETKENSLISKRINYQINT